MTKGRLTVFLSDLREVFLERRWSEIADYFHLPLVIYTEAGVSVVRDKAHLLSMVQEYRSALGDLNVASSAVDFEHRDTPSNRRLRATVRESGFSEDGSTVSSSLIRYFLVEDGDSYKIEMLEYIETPLSLSEVERIVH